MLKDDAMELVDDVGKYIDNHSVDGVDISVKEKDDYIEMYIKIQYKEVEEDEKADDDVIDPSWHLMELRYSKPWEQIGIIWTYGTLEDLSASLNEPIPKVLLDRNNPRIHRMEHIIDANPEFDRCGGKILIYYDGEEMEKETNESSNET